MLIRIEQAKKILMANGVAAIPTETVYGLAARMDAKDAVMKIFSLKNRPSDNPLIVHAASYQQVAELTTVPFEVFEKLARAYWPGPLTLVLPAHEEKVPSIVRADLSTVAVRIPDHPLTLELIQKTGPLVAPSANISGIPSSTSPVHIETDFGKDFPVLDGGICEKGVESTILIYSSSGWKIGRLGAVPLKEIEALINGRIEPQNERLPLCPGQHYRHYSPKTVLTTGTYHGQPFVVGYEDREYPGAEKIFILGDLKHPETIAKNLYSTLRQLDEKGIREAWIDLDFEENGLLKTVKERLKKAAHRE